LHKRLRPHTPLFPYTTLFRSLVNGVGDIAVDRVGRNIEDDSDLLCGLALRDPRQALALTLRKRAVTVRADQARELRKRVAAPHRSEEHTSELQSRENLVCSLL